MARQFNLIPPVCEQAEYHFFQRDKVETQLPELYHKIGEATFVSPPPSPRSSLAFSHRVIEVSILYAVVQRLSFNLPGVGVVSWSPLACGIITGKYENGVPESSRASMKVKISILLSFSPI